MPHNGSHARMLPLSAYFTKAIGSVSKAEPVAAATTHRRPTGKEPRMRKWLTDHQNLLSILVGACVAIVGFVVVVGGIVALVNPDTYPFRTYLADLAAMGKFLIAAAIAVAAKVLGPLVTIGNTNEPTTTTPPAPPSSEATP